MSAALAKLRALWIRPLVDLWVLFFRLVTGKTPWATLTDIARLMLRIPHLYSLCTLVAILRAALMYQLGHAERAGFLAGQGSIFLLFCLVSLSWTLVQRNAHDV